ncbi:MAG: hypothetical protein NTW10_06810 [Bacteroidetes bacterium]|nr:hypothetical protein [Bacteroidota bacterium]
MKTKLVTASRLAKTCLIFFFGMMNLVFPFHSFSQAQNPEPNSVAIIYNSLIEDPSVKTKCFACQTITTNLSDIPGVRAFETQKLNKITDEINLSSSELVKEDSRVRSGKIMIPEHFLTITGVNYKGVQGNSVDAMENYSFTDFKTGKIVYSKNTLMYNPKMLEEFKKVISHTYKQDVAPVAANQGRILRTLYVDLPVEYDFSFKGVFPKVEQAEETVIRESKECMILKDGQKSDKKKDVLSFGVLNGAEGTYSGLGFTVMFNPSMNSDEEIWMKGKFNADRSKLESLEIYHNMLSIISYGDSYAKRESARDIIQVENLVYKKTPMGGQYEFVPGVSKISSVTSSLGFYESGEMPRRILTASHQFKQIDLSRTDPIRGKIVPNIYLMTGDNTPKPVIKPLKKIYLRGNWPGYAMLTEKLLSLYPNADIIDQTEPFMKRVAFERNLNQGASSKADVPGMNIPEKPALNEAVLRFDTQTGNNGEKKIAVEIQTAGKTQTISFSQPSLFKGNPVFNGKEADEKAMQNLGQQQADFTYGRIMSLGCMVEKELNK